MIKRKIALLMAMLIMLCGILISCGNEEERSISEGSAEQQVEDTSSEAEVANKPGDVLSTPEKLIDADMLRIVGNDPDGDHIEITLRNSGYTHAFYIVTRRESSVVEVDAGGKMHAYVYDSETEKFTDAAVNDSQTDNFLYWFSFFGFCFEENTNEYLYEKCEDAVVPNIGEVYVYNVYSKNDPGLKEKKVILWVEKSTGVFVNVMSPEGKSASSVELIQTEDICFPDYK